MRQSRYLWVILCLLLVPVLSLAASGQEELPDIAIKLAEQIEAGDFTETMELFAPSLKGQVSELQLQAGMAQSRLLAGAFERIIGHDLIQADTGPVVDVYARHGGKPLRIRFPFDAQGQLIGLWMQPATWEEVTVLFPQEKAPQTADPRGEEHAVEVGEYRLPGRITTPAADAPRLPIAVLLLAGSGPQDMDETIGEAANKPLRDLALGLAAQGITTLRYDKRTYARADKMGAEVTIQQEVLEDAAAGVQLLTQSEWTKEMDLYVLGHSLGGMLVPEVLTLEPILQGGIILAGSPRSLWEIIYDQNLAAVQSMTDKTDQEKGAMMAEVARMRDMALALPTESAEAPFGMPGSYVRSLNGLNLADKASSLVQPLLIMQGEKDVQVSLDKDFLAWQTLLGKDEDVKLAAYPGLNHLFMAAATGAVEEYNQPAHVDQQVIDDISVWLTDQSADQED